MAEIRSRGATTRGEKLSITTEITRKRWEAETDEAIKEEVENVLKELIAKRSTPPVPTPEQYLRSVTCHIGTHQLSDDSPIQRDF